MSQSLPPGVYRVFIVIGELIYCVTDPDSDNQTLTLTGAQENLDDQLWLISGDGIIRSLSYDKKFASARLAPKTSSIIRSSSSLKWIIAVDPLETTSNIYKGTIRAEDGTKRFWYANTSDKIVELTSEKTEWTFERRDNA